MLSGVFCLSVFQVITLKEEIESLKAEREKVNSSMKDIIHGAEGYKVGILGWKRLVAYKGK